MVLRSVGKDWMSDVVTTRITEAKKINALVWGDSGCGKTTFASTSFKPFFVWAENGALSLGGQDILGYHLQEGAKVYETLMTIAKSARNNEGIFADIDTMVIDSGWKLNQLILEEILVEANLDAPTFTEWGKLRTRMGAIVNQFLSLDKHFILTMGEQLKEEQGGTSLLPAFNMNGGYASQIDFDFDFVLYMNESVGTSGASEYRMHTKPYRRHKAKSRVKLPKVIDNPTFPKLWDFVQAAGK